MMKMNKTVFTLSLILLFFAARAQQKPIRLIVRGDDMGATHSENEALIKCYLEGIETSIEVIVVSPWFPEAVKILHQNPGVDVGIHLALTSEWENIKWRPLTDCPGLQDSNGFFFPMVFANKNYPGQSIFENHWKMEDIEKELRAQIELGLKNIPRFSHVSAHMNFTDLSPEVNKLTRQLAEEYQIDINLDDYQVVRLGYGSEAKAPAEKMDSFINLLNKLEPGKTYCFVDHPGINNDELQAVFHIGYENVATDRQGVTDLFTSEKVRTIIRQKGILLIGYKDLTLSHNNHW